MTPNEFKKLKKQEWLPAAHKVIKSAMLSHMGKADITISVDLFASGTSFDVLLLHYRQLGWVCTFEYDNRDGNYLRFQVPA